MSFHKLPRAQSGISKTHLSLESIRSSGLASFHLSVMSDGASSDCTINLCLLFSFGS
uniref:Uncharacterized protein n=1 Tax=Sinocyclocheilus rhinocerous TaxID=307959 RepID=A0A673JLX0_9TELE